MPAKAFLDDSDFESYWIQSSSGSEGDFLRKKYEFQWWHVLLAGFFLFPFISIFILFGISGTTIDNKEVILYYFLLFIFFHFPTFFILIFLEYS